ATGRTVRARGYRDTARDREVDLRLRQRTPGILARYGLGPPRRVGARQATGGREPWGRSRTGHWYRRQLEFAYPAEGWCPGLAGLRDIALPFVGRGPWQRSQRFGARATRRFCGLRLRRRPCPFGGRWRPAKRA